ncbi:MULTISPECIES: carboxylesterase/lipase family protein [unclassified Streptomyces]|uniref:carboxylesterase/lipase family protein n=1 Tax=unclassified Streptomyces TaxID=2593676 RepID=UPI001BEBFB97|nr:MULTISPECIES: carboxylesterase family protein [unclassified Streptomyces]MBT2404244.1 carboxylesterase family protein [Streptomyces sp. ISL-21]MBT2612921.1 carboxylesterase family protein [Streptomyces sp. ISL-87]
MAHTPGRDQTVVDLPAGRLRGVIEGGVAVFRAVPYAAPPVGDLRWRPARPHPGWSGTRDASSDGPSAPQMYLEGGDPVLGGHGSPPFDEDCLTLSIWTPAADEARRPVLVWIHGGGFVSGSGSLPNYSGETFARDGDLVVVSINYRIGPLGYLYAGPEDGKPDEGGNHWLTDQLAALRWVKENIASFGGDPDTITVAGQSGGAVSTAALAGLPEAQGLISRVILQSPPFGLDLPGPDVYLERTAAYLELAGVKTLAELRALPWPALIGAAGGLFARTMRWGYWPTPFLPVIDGVTLQRHPAQALLHGAATGIDVMIGWTREEANFGFALDEAYAAAGRDQVTDRIADTFGAEAAPEVYRAYERTRPGARPADVLVDLITDELFRVPAVQLAEARAELGRPVWAYQFDLPTPAYEGRLGAAHCLELPFVFANFDRWSHAPFLAGLAPAVRDGLAHAMHRAWIAFARTGDPNHPAMPTWNPYDTRTRTTMRFDSVVTALGDLAGDSRRLHATAVRDLP